MLSSSSYIDELEKNVIMPLLTNDWQGTHSANSVVWRFLYLFLNVIIGKFRKLKICLAFVRKNPKFAQILPVMLLSAKAMFPG